jgi:putative FmdB family regulatory protein
MPTYEYECKKCSHSFEIFQSMSDEAVKICPECGGEVRRLINGGAGVIFKGNGFYSTDKGLDNLPRGTKIKDDNKSVGSAATACAACPHSEGGTAPCAQKAAS